MPPLNLGTGPISTTTLVLACFPDRLPDRHKSPTGYKAEIKNFHSAFLSLVRQTLRHRRPKVRFAEEFCADAHDSRIHVHPNHDLCELSPYSASYQIHCEKDYMLEKVLNTFALGRQLQIYSSCECLYLLFLLFVRSLY